MSKLSTALVLALGLGVTSLVHAGFINNSVQASLLDGTDLANAKTTSALETYTQTVTTSGPEFTFAFLDDVTADLSNDVIALAFLGSSYASPNGATITGSGWSGLHFFDVSSSIEKITNVSFSSSIAAFAQDRISFDDNNIWVRLDSMPIINTDTLNLTATFETSTNPPALPEPATLALLALGLAGLGLMRRKA